MDRRLCCLEGMRTDLISLDAAKAFCSSQYAAPLPFLALYGLTGNARPEAVWSEKLFVGTLRNESIRYVVTEVSIAVDVYEQDGKTKKTHEISVQGWFEPNRAAQDFKSLPIQGVPDDWSQATLPPCSTPRTGRCWEWNIMTAKGLEL